MTNLLEEIKSISKDAARALKCAGCVTDSDIKLLSRLDLNELLPGAENLQVRKKVFEKIQNAEKKPIDVILKELKNFIPDEQFRAPLTGNGLLVHYLNILKEMKGHVNEIQTFIDAHISLLEGLRENQDQEPITVDVNDVQDTVSVSSTCSSGATSDRGSQTVSSGHPQQTHETGITDRAHSTRRHNSTTSSSVQTHTLVTVMSKVVVTGKTLGAHLAVLNQVGKHFLHGVDSFQLHLEEEEDVENCQVIIVFCPVVSRVGTDVESAMWLVPDGKDVILVLMHHTHEAKTSGSLGSWFKPKHVVLHVNIFFHETVGGLLNCKQNNDAVSEIQRKLLDYSSHTDKKQISQNVPSKLYFWKSH